MIHLSPSVVIQLKVSQNGHVSCTRVQCATFVDGSARTVIFVFQSVQKTKTTCKRASGTCFQNFIKFCSAVPEEKSNMSKQIRGLAASLVFWSIRGKNANLLEVVEIFLPVKFRQFLFRVITNTFLQMFGRYRAKRKLWHCHCNREGGGVDKGHVAENLQKSVWFYCYDISVISDGT